ncbi:polysaccharide pyruvyl transferase family protein [Microbulbifer bruguierae]|uniref:Polysaccharide pyruvyl transferase family protein n=1 Tax=Microbulbifer bruguierae TaxID=3029061 RepID=A0ABY8NIG6_9GAMM|nr:polysaccharide pyruvyl transferase family protein [Microbulbifer bruguierae]WGL18229.1 polysaccharide pyruvyl transferase family protein [Microbulbifer bruguierae]
MTAISLLGAAPDTGNLGVSALSRAVTLGIKERIPDADLCVFDNGRGMRRHKVAAAMGEPWTIRRCGLSNSRRIYRRESLAHMQLSQWLPVLDNPGVRAIAESRAVLDISGGDSFTDLYGPHRFELICRPKQISLRTGRPLILLPQTYGPFREKRNRTRAVEIVRRCHSAWARDSESFSILRDLLGPDFDSARHRRGVDVAFLLPAAEPAPVDSVLQSWLAGTSGETVGLNVSGLIYNGGPDAARRYGIVADYGAALQRLLERMLVESSVNILLVPHVQASPDQVESDLRACRQLLARLGAPARSRVQILEEQYDEMQIKWIISRLAWFCGTRMHSTIAALSSGVPCAAIAYSDKTRGVFASCGQQKLVFDPRDLDTVDLVDAVYHAFQQRVFLREPLQQQLPGVLAEAREQMDAIAASCLETYPEVCA